MFDNNVILGAEEENGLLFPEDTPTPPDELIDTPPVDDGPKNDPIEPNKPEEPTFDLVSEINKSFNTNFGDVEALKSVLGANTLPEENNAFKTQYSELEAKHNKLIEEFKKLNDPLSLFGDEFEVKKNALIKTNPALNKDVAGKVLSIDLQNDNPLDIIALDMMLKSKVFKSGEDARALFLKQNGIDVDFAVDDLDVTQKLSIDLAAEKAAQNIEAMRSSVTIPQAVNIDQILSEVTYTPTPDFDITPWNDKVAPLVESIKDFEVKDEHGDVLFTEIVDDEFKQGLNEVIIDTIKVGKMQPTAENIKALADEAIRIYKMENFDKIVRRVKAQIEAREAEKYHKMIHNDQDPDRQTHQMPVKGKTTNLLELWNLPK